MREIKFRVWDDGELDGIGKMKYGNMELFDDMLGFRFPHFSNTVESVNDLKIMQSTGLRDKNGKEIYEGDILQLINTYKNSDHKPWNVVVTYEEASFVTRYIEPDMPNHMGAYNHFDSWSDMVTFEVIGNIYDNPELLREE